MSELSVGPVSPQEQRHFAQYLLPQVRQGENTSILGAYAGNLACGAAAVRWEEGTAVLASLFVDPLVRRRGLGGALADLALRLAAEKSSPCLSCTYVLDQGELAAMNRIFMRRGGVLQYGAPVCCVNMSDYVGARFLGAALKSGYRPPPTAVPFSRLTPEQLACLAGREDIPDALRWESCADKCDRELSLAWVEEGQICAYVLGGESAGGGYLLAAAWRGPESPAASVPALLRCQLNRCWYRAGGGFLYYFSAETPPAQAPARSLTRRSCREYACVSAQVSLE